MLEASPCKNQNLGLGNSNMTLLSQRQPVWPSYLREQNPTSPKKRLFLGNIVWFVWQDPAWDTQMRSDPRFTIGWMGNGEWERIRERSEGEPAIPPASVMRFHGSAALCSGPRAPRRSARGAPCGLRGRPLTVMPLHDPSIPDNSSLCPGAVAIAQNGWSRSIGTPGRDQSELLVVMGRNG